MWKRAAAAASVINQHCLLISSFSPEVGIRETLTLLHLTLQSTVKGHREGKGQTGEVGQGGAPPLERGSSWGAGHLTWPCLTLHLQQAAFLVARVLSLSLGAIPGRRSEVRGNGSSGCQQSSLRSLSQA